MNMEDEIFGTDEEFERRLKEFKDRCKKRCCRILNRTKKKILKQKFAIILFFSSIVTLCVGANTQMRNPSDTGAIIIIYSVTSVCCCLLSLCRPRGFSVYSNSNPENKLLLSPSSSGNKKKSSHLSLENVMEPREGSGLFEARSPYQVAYEVDRSVIYEPLNYDDGSPSRSHAKMSSPKLIYGENSVGTSSAPDPFPPLNYDDDDSVGEFQKSSKVAGTSTPADLASSQSFEHVTYSFAASQSIDGSCDSEEPTQRLSEARLSAHAIGAFGEPVEIFGADKFTVFQGSDEHTYESSTSSGPFDACKIKSFEVSVEVHPNTRFQISSSNDGSSFGEPASSASGETALTAVSDQGNSNKQISSSSSGEPVSIASDETALTPVSDLQDDVPGSLDDQKEKTLKDSDEVYPDSSRQISSNNDGSSSSEAASMASDKTAQKPISDSHDGIPGSFDVHKVKSSQLQVLVEVHPDSSRPISFNNDDSSSSEPASMSSDETVQTPVSDLTEDIPFMDDDY